MAKWSDRLKWWKKAQASSDPVVRRVVREASGTYRAGTVQCPRCRRHVADTPRGRNAHRVGCVVIPENRPAGWGVRPGSTGNDRQDERLGR